MVFEQHLGPLHAPLSNVASSLAAQLHKYGIQPPPESSLLDALIFTALIVLLSLFVCSLALLFTKRDTRNAVLLVGISGNSDEPAVGKTALFKSLRHGVLPKHGTVPSMSINDATFIPHGTTEPTPAFRWIDFPGHARLRHQLAKYLAVAKCIVFVVDAQRFTAQARRDAELLYDILTQPCVAHNNTPVLIFCNKSDMANCAKPVAVQTRLEAELERAKAAHASMLHSAGVATDGRGNQAAVEAEEERVQLGFENEPFSFDHAPGSVTFSSGSAVTNDVESIIKFARSSFV